MQIDKTYKPENVEKRIYDFWEKQKLFTPKIDPKKKPFVITLPPPNVTGGLHAGHAMYVVEDIMARYHKLKHDPTLFLPGFDHASIAVEYLVSKQLLKQGKTKKDIGRQKFLKRATKFADESKDYAREQLKRLGFMMDWTKEAYTMDKTRSRAVTEAFQRLYKKGLIYKGEYLINWCPKCKTAISDLENIHKEKKSKLYYIKYGPIQVATTRPETMLGDTAVAVNPDDKRYKNLIGKTVILPLLNREIPIIADKRIEIDFGTGAVKITPAHDSTDFEIGKKHKLDFIQVIGPDGKMTNKAKQYAGLSIAQARKKVVQDLKNQGLIVKIEDHIHAVGHCERCNTITEPLISKQWFIKIKPLAEKAINAVKTGKIKIIPKKFEKVYFHWLENIHDWCISRQLWWGHKIPLNNENDILDTWFSSGLWPISVFGWPEQTQDLEYFYPTTVRETGYDILFFWVAREIMMCLEMTGKPPFKIVYLHGLVRDKQGKKFSKTAGIGFDPLEIMDKYGTDALRMALVMGNAPGNDLKIEQDKVLAYRKFANKIWNASRFVLQNPQSLMTNDQLPATNKDDKWIMDGLDKTVKKTTKMIEKYRFDLAAYELYHFFWHVFCDKYIEMVKKRKDNAQPVLLEVLKTCLIMLHPFMPFITEEIYQKLPNKTQKSIMLEKWPI